MCPGNTTSNIDGHHCCQTPNQCFLGEAARLALGGLDLKVTAGSEHDENGCGKPSISDCQSISQLAKRMCINVLGKRLPESSSHSEPVIRSLFVIIFIIFIFDQCILTCFALSLSFNWMRDSIGKMFNPIILITTTIHLLSARLGSRTTCSFAFRSTLGVVSSAMMTSRSTTDLGQCQPTCSPNRSGNATKFC